MRVKLQVHPNVPACSDVCHCSVTSAARRESGSGGDVDDAWRGAAQHMLHHDVPRVLTPSLLYVLLLTIGFIPYMR